MSLSDLMEMYCTFRLSLAAKTLIGQVPARIGHQPLKGVYRLRNRTDCHDGQRHPHATFIVFESIRTLIVFEPRATAPLVPFDYQSTMPDSYGRWGGYFFRFRVDVTTLEHGRLFRWEVAHPTNPRVSRTSEMNNVHLGCTNQGGWSVVAPACVWTRTFQSARRCVCARCWTEMGSLAPHRPWAQALQKST